MTAGRVGETALAHRALAGIHFTGSTPTFQHLWQTVGANIAGYASYPRLVGETGGKVFVIAHPSADPRAVTIGLVLRWTSPRAIKETLGSATEYGYPHMG